MKYIVTALIKATGQRDTISKPFDSYSQAEAFAHARRKEIQIATPNNKTMRDVKIEEIEDEAETKTEDPSTSATPLPTEISNNYGLPFIVNYKGDASS